MTGWIDDLARAFEEQPLSIDETSELLGIAREVAHRVERRETPLAAFLVGMRVATRGAAGATRGEALSATIAEVAQMLPPAAEEP